jgi:hypothetical protein
MKRCLEMEPVPNMDAGAVVMRVNRNHPGCWGVDDAQRLSYLHLMNKAAESEDRQSYFYYLKLAEQTLQRQDPEVLWKPAG